jgi:hypothetical protein
MAYHKVAAENLLDIVCISYVKRILAVRIRRTRSGILRLSLLVNIICKPLKLSRPANLKKVVSTLQVSKLIFDCSSFDFVIIIFSGLYYIVLGVLRLFLMAMVIACYYSLPSPHTRAFYASSAPSLIESQTFECDLPT